MPDPTTLPRWAERFVLAVVRRPHAEYLVGELEEYHAQMLARGGSAVFRTLGLSWQLTLILGSLVTRPSMLVVSGWSSYLLSDIRVGVRSILRTPVVASIAVATLALGMGATAVVFSLVDATLLTPLPYASPERVVRVWGDRTVSKDLGLQYIETTRSLESASLFHAAQVVMTGNGAPERLSGISVLPSHFSVLGVRPHLGATFAEEATVPGAPGVAILSYGLWQRRFSGDSSVIGRTIEVEGEPTTVIGVLKLEHVPMVSTAQIWLPMEIDRGDFSDFTGVARSFLVARLGPGFSEAQAASELRTFAERQISLNPESFGEDFLLEATVVPVHETMVAEESQPLRILMMSVGLVLLVSCANVANLLLSHASGRMPEACLRRALGASRRRVVLQFMTEYALLGALGTVGGLVFGHLALRAVLSVVPADFPMRESIAFDGRVLLFAFLLTVPTAILIGLLPALGATGGSPSRALRGGGSRISTDRSRTKLTSLVVAVEVALAVVLVIGSGLLLRSVDHLLNVDVGFVEDELVTMQVSLPDNGFDDPGARSRFFGELDDRIGQLPFVDNAGMVAFLPMAGATPSSHFEAEGEDRPANAPPRSANFQMVLGNYFETMSMRLVEGRFLDPDASGNLQGVINRTLAEQAFPGESALGRRITIFGGGAVFEVVGVVEDVHQVRASVDPDPEAFLSYRDLDFWPALTVVARTSAEDPMAVADEIRSAVWEIDSDVPVTRIASMESVRAGANSRLLLLTRMISSFAVVALVLAAVGVFGVLHYAGSMRRREFGIRSALGESRRRMVSSSVVRGLRPVALGAIAGTVTALLGANVLAGYVYGVPTRDPVTFVGVVFLIAVVSAVAAVVPAMRATNVDVRDVLSES